MTTREIINTQNDYGELLCSYRPAFSQWEIVDQKDVKDGKEAYYQLMAGDPQYPATIRIGAYEKADGTKSYSARMDTFVKVTDDNDAVTYKNISYTIARSSNDGCHGGEDNDRIAIQNLMIFAGFQPPLATPALGAETTDDTTIAVRRKFGIPTFDLAVMDDPAES